jgi:hypothetical protein
LTESVGVVGVVEEIGCLKIEDTPEATATIAGVDGFEGTRGFGAGRMEAGRVEAAGVRTANVDVAGGVALRADFPVAREETNDAFSRSISVFSFIHFSHSGLE